VIGRTVPHTLQQIQSLAADITERGAQCDD
jgi:hypothetical protein